MEILPYIKSKIRTKRDIRFLYQRLTRGWDDSDTWSLDYPIAKFILPRLVRFKDLTMGHPCSMTEEEWNAIIDEMIWGFKWIIEDNSSHAFDVKGSFNQELFDKHYAQEDRANAAMETFGKYYRNLWW
jgi:hypothetical protein